MKGLHVTLAAMLFAVLLVSCSDNPTDSGQNSSSGAYMPHTKNSTWTYTGSVNYTITAAGDTTIAGKTYAIMQSTAGPTSLLNYENGSYYSSAINLSQKTLFLKDNVPTGSTWAYEVPSANGTANQYTLTFVEDGLTRTVNGTSYSDVAHVHLVDSVAFFGQKMLVSDADYYYAKNVGMIEADLKNVGGKMTLASYSIK